jgi:cytochrome c
MHVPTERVHCFRTYIYSLDTRLVRAMFGAARTGFSNLTGRMACARRVVEMIARVLLVAALLPVALTSLPFTAARAEGDPEMGKRQFGACLACHTVEAGGPNRIGPNLHGILGKKAGTNTPDFAYSDALKNSGIVWNDENLIAWIKKPSALIQGSKMTFIGLPKEEAQENVLAYLKEATK